MRLDIDFLQYKDHLRLTETDGAWLVFDPIRRKNVVLTPEELLRQLVLTFLLVEMKYPPQRIRSEVGIEWNGMKKRCDLVVFDRAVQPWLLIECKSPKISLSQSTFEQAAMYNLHLRAPFLAITNGLETFCCALHFESQRFAYLPNFPDF